MRNENSGEHKHNIKFQLLRFNGLDWGGGRHTDKCMYSKCVFLCFFSLVTGSQSIMLNESECLLYCDKQTVKAVTKHLGILAFTDKLLFWRNFLCCQIPFSFFIAPILFPTCLETVADYQELMINTIFYSITSGIQ
jgi:hypothetical protein